MRALNIIDYNDLNENKFYNKVCIYIIVVLILLFISIIVLLKIKKSIYYSNRVFIIGDNIITNIAIDDLNNITNHQYMIIDKNYIKYEIKNIELVSDVITYYKVSLSLENNYKKNNIMEYKIQLQKDNMLNYLISFIGG